MLPKFFLERPTDIETALALLSESHMPYSGGTELLLAMRMGLLRPDALVDVKRLPGMHSIETTATSLRIGGAVTHAAVIADDLVAQHTPFLADVERRVGNPRVRSQGSLGGNLCFAEPKSDVITALVALKATVTLQSIQGERELAVADFIEGPYASSRDDQELLTHIDIPLVPHQRHAAYAKYQIQERPTAAVAIVSDGEVKRVVLGAAGEVPVWKDYPLRGDVAVGELVEELDPIPDTAGSADYKRHICAVHLERALQEFEATL